jgi:hypothetical protein
MVYLLKMVIFHGHVKYPDGTYGDTKNAFCARSQRLF